jgi:hypothetical protein
VRAEEGERELGSEGECCRVLWGRGGVELTFYNGRGSAEEAATADNGRSSGLNAIDGRGG